MVKYNEKQSQVKKDDILLVIAERDARSSTSIAT